MRRLVAALTLAAAVCAAVPATASAGHCGQIAFEPQTDNGAANIHARGTSCRRGRRIVRQVYNGDRTPFGYSCRSRPHVTKP